MAWSGVLLASGLLTGSQLSAQVNDLRISTPSSVTQPPSRAASETLVRSAIYERAISARGGNSIRLASHKEPSSESLRWVDPVSLQPELQDAPASRWHTRGELPTTGIQAAPQPSANALDDPFGDHPARSNASKPSALELAPPSDRPASDWNVFEERPKPISPSPAYLEQAQPPSAPLPEPANPSVLPLDELPSPMNAQLSALQDPLPDESSDLPPVPSPDLLKPWAPDQLPEDVEEYYRQRREELLSSDMGRDCRIEQQQCGRVRLTSIRDITLDITPDFAPALESPEEREAALQVQLSRAPSRSWQNSRGELVAEGKLADISQGNVHIQSETGIKKIALHELGNDERCFVAAWWKLPLDCLTTAGPRAPRAFPPMTFTWTASGLCHKPLYFEQTQLERYGHAAHPLVQPVLSGAHFFTSIALLPYSAGIHPSYECQFELGHYRVGSCAPWMLPPVPISLRGGLMQASAVVGGVFLLP